MYIRRKRALGLLVVCSVCIIAMATGGAVNWRKKNQVPVPYVDKIMGIAVVEDSSFLDNRERMTCDRNPGICFEEVLLPFDKSGVLYLSQGKEENWTGKLSAAADSYFLCTPQDAYWGRKKDAVRENHSFTLWLVGENCYYEMQLIISGMPVISILTSYSREPKEDIDADLDEIDPDLKYFGLETEYYGTIDVFNPGVNTEKYEILQSYVCYHQKGVTSASYVKKSYSLSLQNHKQQNVNTSLLGMRMDNSWKLNALFNDPNRIREITASQIWEQFDEADGSVNEAGPRMEYVELVLDGCYQGIYCLVEPVDGKKLDLDRNDVLYKYIGWDIPSDEDIQESVDMNWKIQSSIRVRYPETITDYYIAWFPIRDYLNTFYRNQVLPYEELASRVSIANAVDKQLFVMIVSGEDNYLKNTFFKAEVDAPEQYIMYQVPWDLDLTFGNQYDYNARNACRFNSDYTVEYKEQVITSLYEADPDKIGEYLMARWKHYRESFLSTENILNLLKNNRNYLIETGAVLREQERWPDEEIDMDIDYLLDYQTKRMEWLAWYFGE